MKLAEGMKLRNTLTGNHYRVTGVFEQYRKGKISKVVSMVCRETGELSIDTLRLTQKAIANGILEEDVIND